MISLIVSTIALATASLTCEEPRAEVIQTESTDLYKIKKIRFSGHTYIHIKNMWSTADFKYMYDPDCRCVTDAVKKILDRFEEK